MKDPLAVLVARFKDAPPPLPGRPVDLDAAKALAEWRAHPNVASGGLLTDTYVPIYLAALVAEVESLRDQVGIMCHEARHLAEARAEVERLTSERDVEKDMRIERACLLVAERLRFTVAYDAVQQMHRERGEARAEVERLRGAVRESLAYDPYGMAGGAQIPLRALNVG